MLEVFRKLGSIQFDPIAVAGRNHDLVLHARVAGYEPAWCEMLYERREILRGDQQGAVVRPDERLLERIRAEGPLSSLDFERETGPTKNWFGMPENAVRAVLEAYTVTGVLGLARRDGNLRYYDLLERLLPAEVLAHEVPEREQLRHKLLSRYRAHGLLGAGGAGGTFDRIVPPKSTPERVGRNELREELVELGAYVLPILFGDRFVGQFRPRIDRDEGRVEVLGVWWEDGFAPRRADGFVDAICDALRAYLRFAGVSRLDWAPHLATEKRLFLTRP